LGEKIEFEKAAGLCGLFAFFLSRPFAAIAAGLRARALCCSLAHRFALRALTLKALHLSVQLGYAGANDIVSEERTARTGRPRGGQMRSIDTAVSAF